MSSALTIHNYEGNNEEDEEGGARGTRGRGKEERHTKCWSETLTRRGLLENLRVRIRITLKYILVDTGLHCRELFDLAQDRFHWRGFLNVVIILQTA
jgi:hypothetical protein